MSGTAQKSPSPRRKSKARAWLPRGASVLAMDPLEREVGGRASGVLFIAAGISGLIYPLLPGAVGNHDAWLIAVSALALIWGLLTVFVINWRQVDPIYTHLATLAALVAIGIGMWATGGMHSFAWVYLVWIALFGCYFYAAPVAAFYIAAAIATQAAPLVYDSDAVNRGYLAQLIVAAVGYTCIGLLVAVSKRTVVRLRSQSETLAAEQGALQRAASAVMRGEDPDAVFRIIAREFAGVLQGNIGGIGQMLDGDSLKLVSAWTDGVIPLPNGPPVGQMVPAGAIAGPVRAGKVVRLADTPADSFSGRLGCRSALYAPVNVGGTLWGVLWLGGVDRDRFTEADAKRIEAFSGLVAHIVTSLEDRSRLESEALTDQLTGLSNHRALKQRLVADAASAKRVGRPLSVAMIDLDNFKEVNDLGGHAIGDEALQMVAECLRIVVRVSDTVGRLGGDEFMWIMPGTDSAEALIAVERVRQLIARRQFQPWHPTTSVGICDTASTNDPDEIVRRADMALYTSKVSGRNRTTVYDADATLAARVREEWVERSQAMVGLRALARAIDAKDPATSEHSERVSAFAGRLAQGAGWPAERVDRLREAALVHDLGKLGITDALLTKPSRLTDDERQQMNEHAEMSARIVGSVLSEEQVSWIRCHHERPDGGGYPAGLTADQIPDGAALISLSDAWDVMVAGRRYSRSKTPQEAFDECLALRGTQFTEGAVSALMALQEAGLLGLEQDPELPAVTAGSQG